MCARPTQYKPLQKYGRSVDQTEAEVDTYANATFVAASREMSARVDLKVA